MAEIALAFLLEQMKEVVIGYKDLIAGAKNEFQQLNSELDQLKRSLKDMTRVSNDSETSKGIEMRIRELVYEVEDTVDDWLTQAVEDKERAGLPRCVQPTRINLAQQVKSLRQQKVKPMLDQVRPGEFRAREEGYEENQQNQDKKKDLSSMRHKVIPLEDEEKTIIDELMKPMDNLDLISIIGMPGLGKTALAWRIYQDQYIVDAFPIRIWINVSQRFNQRKVFLEILEQSVGKGAFNLIGNEPRNLELGERIRACLEKEKFLLVLDDVWSVEDWQAIENVLPTENRISKVVVTSRDGKVGTCASVSRKPHLLRFLEPEESWKLLQLEVFKDLNHCPDKLKGIGRDIAEQCGGVPLTVTVIGQILAELCSKTQSDVALEKEWRKVYASNVNRFLDDKKKAIRNVVALSYDRLPDDLKDCFLYLGVFPENQRIPVWTLTRLWIAEGFIQPCKGKTLEESAEENVYDLINRNLLMVGDKKLDQVKTCHVHDMIRAFCRSTASEQNLFQMMETPSVDPQKSDEVQNCHRLCLHFDLNKFLSKRPNVPLIRSLLYFYGEVDCMEERHANAIPNAFHLLRVLHSKSIKFHEFPGNLTNLTHLRYMVLCIDNLKHIPEQICQLWNLQTFVVDTNSKWIEMKANIWKMVRLRHLKTKAAIALDKNWKGRAGENLQTLSRVSPESWTSTICEKASNLKTLGIRGKVDPLIDTMSLEKFRSLERLRLIRELQCESPRENPLPRLPPSFPPNLKRLTLSNTFLEWKHMSTLAAIESLEVIKLKSNAFTGYSWSVATGGFQSLQLLLIVNSDLVRWEAQENSFPSLRCLVLKHCEKLQQIPLAVAGCLEKLEIAHLRRSAVDSANLVKEHQSSKYGVPLKLTQLP